MSTSAYRKLFDDTKDPVENLKELELVFSDNLVVIVKGVDLEEDFEPWIVAGLEFMSDNKVSHMFYFWMDKFF